METGSTVGHYKVLRKLGSGGMGEVFLVDDPRLARQVALKVVLPEVAADPSRRARFESEARAIAALNHPNIVTIHSIERDRDLHFITMEFVSGKPLSAEIPASGLPLKRFLDLALPLVEAVAAAHQHGVTHRDLKPDNVMVTSDGRVKVLDFGLAKLKHTLDEDAETVMTPSPMITTEGQVIGTVAYMSPEQAEGRPLDSRSDIFSLGILLFEMATGRRPFGGSSAASIVSSILRDEPPPVNQLNPEVPPQIAQTIRRCLAKEPSRRHQSALDVRNDLAEVKAALESGTTHDRPRAAYRPPWRIPAAVAVAIVFLAAVVVLLRQYVGGREQEDHVGEVVFTKLTDGAGQELFPSLSPDGRTVVYASAAAGNMDIYSLRVGGQNATNLTADWTDDDSQPTFSPDGEHIAFRSERNGGGLFIMGATGEAVRPVSRRGYHPAWSPDGRQILYVTQNVTDPALRFTTSQLWVVSVEGGEERLLSEGDAAQPAWSPHGDRIAYWGRTSNAGTGEIWTIPAGGGAPIAVTNDAALDWNPAWSPDGRYLYFSSTRGGSMSLWRIRVNEASGEVLGRAVPITTGGGAASQHVSLAKDGKRLTYVARVESMNVQKVAFDPAAETLAGIPEWVTRGSGAAAQPDPSPDGTHLVFNSSNKDEDIFITSTAGTGSQQVTVDQFEDRAPRWSPNGQRIAFYSNRTGKYEIWTINRDGSDRRQLTRSPGAHYPVWSPVDTRMAYSTHAPNGAFIFDTAKPWEAQQPQPLPAIADPTQTFEIWSWSPDGTRLAGQKHLADLSHAGIAIHTVGSTEIRWLTDVGEWPVWLGDNRRLLYSHRGKLFVIDSVSGRQKEILSLPQNTLGSVGLSKDNRTIYFTLQSAEADVWMATLK